MTSGAELTPAQPATPPKIEARGVCKVFETPRGRVSAEHCLIATNAYTPPADTACTSESGASRRATT